LLIAGNPNAMFASMNKRFYRDNKTWVGSFSFGMIKQPEGLFRRLFVGEGKKSSKDTSTTTHVS
jgi:hypothetical protein